MRRPRKQSTVRTALGPVEVTYVADVKSSAGKAIANALGWASFESRVIQIKSGMHEKAEAHTLRHEWAHFITFDAGLNNILTEKQVEMVCDAFATALYDVPIP